MRCGRRPERSGADAERIDGAGRRAVGTHHLSGVHDDRRWSACGAAIFVDLGTSGKKASELAGQITHYPQLLQNVKVGSNEEKTAILNSAELAAIVAREEERLAGHGRILLRASGTEPLIRVMAEADTQDLAESVVKTLVQAVENIQKILNK